MERSKNVYTTTRTKYTLSEDEVKQIVADHINLVCTGANVSPSDVRFNFIHNFHDETVLEEAVVETVNEEHEDGVFDTPTLG